MSRNERLIRRSLGDWVYESYIEVSLLAMMALVLLVIVGTIQQMRRARLRQTGKPQ
ncbi:hypothetical protein [Kaistia granuli]|uniref:hypothetical protein n=1 Tax=Kaistia granuli TaxID=363259 RepID=UPI0012EBFC90|nr:hypothetical protein [Kaistia granuli]